jgi:hypothetical protein
MDQINFVILAIGNLGTSGEISLKSILSLNPKRICYLADQKGESWLVETLNRNNTNIKILCSHKVNKIHYEQLKINQDLQSRYFGQEDFIRITPLKWLIINQSLVKHNKEKLIVFSDLDVLWLKSQEIKNPKKIQIQDDSWELTKKQHYCTGIMVWPNSTSSKKITKQIYTFQRNLIIQGNLIPDEPAFNGFINQYNATNLITPLNKDIFIIGHRVIALLRKEKGILDAATAYHANYFIGNYQKKIVLKTILSRRKKGKYWIFGYITIHLFKVKNRITILTTKFSLYKKEINNEILNH